MVAAVVPKSRYLKPIVQPVNARHKSFDLRKSSPAIVKSGMRAVIRPRLQKGLITNGFRRMNPSALELAIEHFSSAANLFIATITDNVLATYAGSYRTWLVDKAKGSSVRPPFRLSSTPAASLVRLHLNELFNAHFSPG